MSENYANKFDNHQQTVLGIGAVIRPCSLCRSGPLYA